MWREQRVVLENNKLSSVEETHAQHGRKTKVFAVAR